MKFVHLSDCHIGGWRDDKLSILGIKAFEKAIDESIAKQADFVLISGDLFNSALPPIDKLKGAVIVLKKLKNNEIPCYIIPGSHDFSPSGKTMLDVLEHAGLYGGNERGMEGLTEFLAQVADGNINLKDAPRDVRRNRDDVSKYQFLRKRFEVDTDKEIFILALRIGFFKELKESMKIFIFVKWTGLPEKSER